MLLCRKFALLFCVLACLDFRLTYTEDFRLFDFDDTLTIDYLRYRSELGCYAPLCSEIQQQNTTYSYSDNFKNDFQDHSITKFTNLSLTDINNSSNVNNTNCGSTCSCSDDCLRYGYCCLDKITNDFILSSRYPIGGTFDCGTSGVKTERDISRETFKLINKCIRTFDHTDIIEACIAPSAMKLEYY